LSGGAAGGRWLSLWAGGWGLAVLRISRQAANNPVITGSDRGRGRGPAGCVITPAVLLRQRLQHPRSIRWQVGCGAQGRQALSTAADTAVAFLASARGYPQRRDGRTPGAELAASQEAMTAYLDFLMAAVSGVTMRLAGGVAGVGLAGGAAVIWWGRQWVAVVCPAAVGTADQRGARVSRVQAEDDPHRGGLAGGGGLVAALFVVGDLRAYRAGRLSHSAMPAQPAGPCRVRHGLATARGISSVANTAPGGELGTRRSQPAAAFDKRDAYPVSLLPGRPSRY
jgi:hypothetical protein